MVNINKTPVDPLSTSNYIYGISYDKKYFQIGIVLESGTNKTSFNNNPLDSLSFVFPLNKGDLRGIENVYSASGAGNYFSKIKGNYNGIIKFSTGTTNKIYYIANIPSLLYNDTNPNLLNTGTYYVVNNNTNLPYQISPDTTTNNKTADVMIQEINNSPTATLTGIDITAIVNSTGTTSEINNLIASTFTGITLSSFGGNIGVVTSTINNGVIQTSGGGGGGETGTGVCGSNNGQTLASIPSTNLCSAGTASSVVYTAGVGQYTWSCGGVASCKAYDNNSVLLLHLDNDFVESSSGKTETHSVANSSVSFSNAITKIGSYSAYWGGSSYFSVPASNDWQLGTGMFSIDFWMYPKTLGTQQHLVGQYSQGSDDGQYWNVLLQFNNKIEFRNRGGDTVSCYSSSTLATDTWYHIAVTRDSSNNVRIFINGALSSTCAISNNFTSNSTIYIGKNVAGGLSWNYTGYLDELRISKGIARWTADFSGNLPSSPY